MLGPFDWYSAIEIGIAAAVVGIIVLISCGKARRAASQKEKPRRRQRGQVDSDSN